MLRYIAAAVCLLGLVAAQTPPPVQTYTHKYSVYNITGFPFPPAIAPGFCQPINFLTTFIGSGTEYLMFTCSNTGVATWSFYSDAACSVPVTSGMAVVSSANWNNVTAPLIAADRRAKGILPFPFWSCDPALPTDAILLEIGGSPTCTGNTMAKIWGSPQCVKLMANSSYMARADCTKSQAAVWGGDANCNIPAGVPPLLGVSTCCGQGSVGGNTIYAKFYQNATGCDVCTPASSSSASTNSVVTAFAAVVLAFFAATFH